MISNISLLFCSKLPIKSIKNDESDKQKHKFLSSFLKYSSIESAEIYNYKIRDHYLKDFVVYKILVQTTEIQYKIERRYNDFLILKEKIQERIPTFKCEEEFPSKKIFGNLETENLLFRKEKLSSFIQDVLKLQKDPQVAENILIDFFSVQQCYMKSDVDMNFFIFKDEIYNLAVTEDDKILLELMFTLSKETENMICNFSKLHEFFEKSPKLSLQIIQIFFKGYGNLKGMISLCHDLNSENSTLHLACCSCLKLLCFLMDFEENPNAEIFVEVFAALSSREFASLGLAHHIVETPSKICKKSSLKLLDIYKGANPHTNSFLFSQMIDNEEAFDAFLKWKSSMTIVSQKTESFSIDYIENSNDLSQDTKQESKKFFRINSSLLSERPKSGLFKRKSHLTAPYLKTSLKSD